MTIPGPMLQQINDHAEAVYPEECCGVVFARVEAPDALTRVRRCRNAQDDFHALDPDTFPRTALTAYFIDPKDLLAIEKETRDRGEFVRVIYHSHPDAEAYFSEEDQRRAISHGEPLFPDVQYLVVSVKLKKAQQIRMFAWDAKKRTFLKIEQIAENSR